ncbi:Hypothetical predicted protein [Pelobates cultripes]|uniref:Uncharacterized protein n=1 Tax=Pelobates cultripes TaxID=61616 RepID=A0AAD1T1N0_PELCU|nr:Hypothetical predicted protein [Pelobates cultripes]
MEDMLQSLLDELCRNIATNISQFCKEIISVSVHLHNTEQSTAAHETPSSILPCNTCRRYLKLFSGKQIKAMLIDEWHCLSGSSTGTPGPNRDLILHFQLNQDRNAFMASRHWRIERWRGIEDSRYPADTWAHSSYSGATNHCTSVNICGMGPWKDPTIVICSQLERCILSPSTMTHP